MNRSHQNDIDREYREFIEKYKQDKYHKSYSLSNVDLYSYSSNKGKFGIANLLIDILISDYSPIESKLFLAIINTLKQSYDFEESAVVYLKHSIYSKVCSVNIFSGAIKKLVKDKLLVPTPKNKKYIVNPLYVNKFFKEKKDKPK